MKISDIYQLVSSDVNQYSLIAVALLAALFILVLLNRKNFRRSRLNSRTNRKLKRLGLKQIKNFRCPDGMGDYFVIDRLLMNNNSISVIMFMQYPGIIFCADNIEEWSQLVGGKSYKFKNPLVNLEHQVSAVSNCIPGVSVNGYLFFDHQAEFPKGKPDRVIQINSIPDSLKKNKKAGVEEPVKAAWEKLRKLVK